MKPVAIRPLAVGFLLLPGFTLTPFASLLDVLRLSADDGDGSRPRRIRWRILGDAPVRCSAGVVVQPDEPPTAMGRFDYIIVCGGLLKARPDVPAIWCERLRDAAAAGATIVAVCTGSFLLAEAGLLDGRQACVSWFHEADFAADFPAVRTDATRLFAIDGNVVTCAGGTGAVDVGAWIVERHIGHAAARKALDILVVDDARPAEAPQPRPSLAGPLDDARLRRCALLIEQRLSAPPSIAALARHVNLSGRQLTRLFQAETGLSPQAYAADLRLRYAAWAIRSSSRTLASIATEYGFADAAHLSNRYRARYGHRPSMDRAGGGAPGEQRPCRA